MFLKAIKCMIVLCSDIKLFKPRESGNALYGFSSWSAALYGAAAL